MDNNIIASMLKIEQDAKNRLAEAERKRDDIIADAEAERDRIIKEKTAAADAEKERVCSDERERTDQKLAEIERSKSSEIGRLDDVYEKSHTEWENIIFNAVIGG